MGKRTRRHRDRRERSRSGRLEELVARAAAGGRLAVGQLADAWEAGEPVAALVDDVLRRVVAQQMSVGWTTDELERIAAKHVSSAGRDLVTVDLAELRSRRRLSTLQALEAALEVVRVLSSMPAPPGERPATGASGPRRGLSGVDDAVLAKVRALLAKAESTAFPAEAEALSAKAHELMARHAIDTALLAATGGPGSAAGTVGSRRIGIDDPYAQAKVQLLHQVAQACGCKAIWFESAGIVTVFGFDADLEAVELLHTSVLVQATAAMLAAGGERAGSHSRSRGFRSSFLMAYALRVGARLEEATAAVVAEAEEARGGDLLPVLASRAEAVDAAVDAACPDRRSRTVTAGDTAGRLAGDAAGARADLGARLRPVGRAS